jgi:acetyl-CoA synthetase (ADP-forming)
MADTATIISNAYREGRKVLLEPEARQICLENGIIVPKFKVARNQTEMLRFADEVGYPLVLKIVSPDILHKSDAGAVMVNLKTAEEASQAYTAIMENVRKYKPDARIVGMLVQAMAPQSTEVIVGALKDPQFGPTVMFGLGGIFVELLKDVSFRIAPVTKQDALEMIREVKAYPMLTGYRRTQALDIDALASIIANVSALATKVQAIKEIDLNPLMLYEKGALAVDARIILE